MNAALAVHPHQQCSCRSLPSRAVFLLLQPACAVTVSPCGPVCHLCRYRSHCSVSPLHPRPSRSVCFSLSVFHLFSSRSSAFRTCWARPLHLSVPVAAPWSWHSCCVCCCQGTEKRKKKAKGGREKKNSRLLEADGGWHWGLLCRGQTHRAGNWVITLTGFVWDQHWAELTGWSKICSFFKQTADLIQLCSNSVNTASSYTPSTKPAFFFTVWLLAWLCSHIQKSENVKEFFGCDLRLQVT